ncbi:MAG: CoA transferase [Chloroflexi bacterium]|nr:CoA transferase [Chloroflexota bacterium]MDA1239691.1 CoA transferase [Chloroflexota bacterium]
MEQPLAGTRIVEVGGALAAAAATKAFSDFGADVIAVEPLAGGQVRRLPPFPGDRPDINAGAFHLSTNTGKQSIPLDLESPSGREVLGRLLQGADLAVTELSPDATRRILLLAEAAGVSIITITPHGLTGPYADRRETDTSIFAWSTRMHTHSQPGRAPLRYAPHLATMQVGSTAAAAGFASIWATQHGQPRREIEIAGIEAISGNVDSFFLQWSFMGAEAPRTAGRSKAAYPAGNYRCKDGWVMFAAAGDRFFGRLCEALGQPDLPKDPRFATPLAKAEHFDDFMAHLGPWLETRTRHEVVTELQAFGVMVSPTLTAAEVLTDVQATARGTFVTFDQPGVGAITIPGPPFRLRGGDDDAWQARPAPRLGEHTVALLDGAGYSRDEQIALFRAGVTG